MKNDSKFKFPLSKEELGVIMRNAFILIVTSVLFLAGTSIVQEIPLNEKCCANDQG